MPATETPRFDATARIMLARSSSGGKRRFRMNGIERTLAGPMQERAGPAY
jgi:hypothetical protein